MEKNQLLTWKPAKELSLETSLEKIYHSSLCSVLPKTFIPQTLQLKESTLFCKNLPPTDLREIEKIYLLSIGKSAVPMAEELAKLLGKRIESALIITHHKTERTESFPIINVIKTVKIIEAGHPIPNSQSQWGAKKALEFCEKAKERDLVIVAISGGSSALVSLAEKGISLQDKQKVFSLLLDSGAEIEKINVVRKQISQIKGGKLAKKIAPARCLSLILSDVLGDDPSLIGSGVTFPNSSGSIDAYRVLKEYYLLKRTPKTIVQHLKKKIAKETQKKENISEISLLYPSSSPPFQKAQHCILANNWTWLSHAKKEIEKLGFPCFILSYPIREDVKKVAEKLVLELQERLNSLKGITFFLTGGECTLKIQKKDGLKSKKELEKKEGLEEKDGIGGRNMELALSFLIQMKKRKLAHWQALFASSDGRDGTTDASGAFCSHQSLAKALSLGLDPKDFLKKHDSYSFFQKLSSLFITGTTGTNVNDIVLILYEGEKAKTTKTIQSQ